MCCETNSEITHAVLLLAVDQRSIVKFKFIDFSISDAIHPSIDRGLQ